MSLRSPGFESAPTAYEIEKDQPLSNSLIWKVQRSFYEQNGIKAWSGRIVPNYITTNTWIANKYAKIVLAYLQDLLYTCPPRNTSSKTPLLDLNEPLYIIELGAGTGRFCHYFLQAFLPMIQQFSALKDLKVRYIIADCTKSNLEYCLNHSKLKPYLKQGIVDAAIISSNEVDESGALFEALVTVETKSKETNLEDPSLINRIRRRFTRRGIDADYRYQGEFPKALNGVLKTYREKLCAVHQKKRLEDTTVNKEPRDNGVGLEDELNSDQRNANAFYSSSSQIGTSFLLPVGACVCFEAISELCSNADGIMCLCSDKGYNYMEEFAGKIGYPMSVEGSFSFMANLHALGLYFEEKGGISYHSSQQAESQGDTCLATSLHILTGLGGSVHSADSFPFAQAAFKAEICSFGPVDYMRMMNLIQPYSEKAPEEVEDSSVITQRVVLPVEREANNKQISLNSEDDRNAWRDDCDSSASRKKLKTRNTQREMLMPEDDDFGSYNTYRSVDGVVLDESSSIEDCMDVTQSEDVTTKRETLMEPINGVDSQAELGTSAREGTSATDLQHILSLWRSCNFDPVFFWQVRGHLLVLVDATTEAEKAEIEKALTITSNNYYYIGEEDDIPFELGRCAYQLHLPGHSLALYLYMESICLFGDHYITYFNIALCYKEIGHDVNAKVNLIKAIELNGKYEPAKQLLSELNEKTQ